MTNPLNYFILAITSNPNTEVDNDDIQQTVSMESKSPDSNRQRGLFLPFEPLSITFQDVCYSVDMPKVFINMNICSFFF